MKIKLPIIAITLLLAISSVSCSTKAESRSFAEVHDAFETRLVKKLNDQDEIPAPPKGVFDLAYYDSKIGKLAAYVSSDPGDGQKHPLLIWAVGGWSNGIDDFPWTYPSWDNDQTASAFREAGILMMYPSFRGANGNPGYYETLFGEIEDLAAAYDYVASLPYVDPDRIYLGGHSTGGTKVLLASAYTDKFRAVFSFGPVDEIKLHNTSQFTFDTGNRVEYRLRSPIYWLDDINTPTFIIEGEDGNSDCARNIEKRSTNGNIHCYVIDEEDHFSILAPLTRLLAQKILADTGGESNIALSKQELQAAMYMPPVEPMPIMLPYKNSEFHLSVLIPVIWEAEADSEEAILYFASPYDEENFWDASSLFVELYDIEDVFTLEQFKQELNSDKYDYQIKTIDVNGQYALIGECINNDSNGNRYYNMVAAIQDSGLLIMFWFYTPETYADSAYGMFLEITNSIELK